MTTVMDRFASRIDRNGSIPEARPDLGRCWLWLGCLTKKGYAERVNVAGIRVQPYRLLWELENGPMPEGTVPDHLCRVRACVNPAHIEPVPPRVNTLRGESFSAVYRRRAHCPQGHEYTMANVRIYRARRYCRACNNAGGRGRRQAVAA